MSALRLYFFFFFFNDTATTEIYTLSLHDALPIYETFDAFGAQDPLHFTGDVGIFLAEKLRAMLDDRHATAEATVRLAEFETDIASAEHDQVWRHVVDFQPFDAGERAGRLQAGKGGNRTVSAH